MKFKGRFDPNSIIYHSSDRTVSFLPQNRTF